MILFKPTCSVDAKNNKYANALAQLAETMLQGAEYSYLLW